MGALLPPRQNPRAGSHRRPPAVFDLESLSTDSPSGLVPAVTVDGIEIDSCEPLRNEVIDAQVPIKFVSETSGVEVTHELTPGRLPRAWGAAPPGQLRHRG